ncbi:MAG TPA: phosphotransferase, partial [Gammaproteobacteria bacterium]|nr:phosphotransferase [Gammaproteobacteria bacterium]
MTAHDPAASATTTDPDQRLSDLHHWLVQTLAMDVRSIEPASSDASFRRYFRIRHGGGSLIAMDAPPAREDSRPFIEIAARLRGIGLNAPAVLEADLEQGYLLLSDLGDQRYLDALDSETVERLYLDALAALERLQVHGPRAGLPDYDKPLLLREMQLFPDWLLERHLGLALDPGQRAMLEQTFEMLAEAALEQPRVCVHRDYHSRNLMVTAADNPGVLDFQDAVLGPITYDLVSLLRDCYIAWPRAQVEAWALGYLQRPQIRALVGEATSQAWLRWFDLMGVQRHLKASGIFARLWHRDGKPGYLGDVPRTLQYIV